MDGDIMKLNNLKELLMQKKFLEVKQIIEDRIIHGIYTVGNYIPTEIEFEKEFNVSKVTVRSAIKELVNLGYLEKKSGKGTTVINHKQRNNITNNKNFTEKLVEQGNKIQKIIKDITVVVHEENSQLFQMFGVKSYNNDLSIYKILEEEKMEIQNIEDNFSVGFDEEASIQLNLNVSEPLLIRERETYAVSGEVIEYSIGYYNSKLKKYTISLKD